MTNDATPIDPDERDPLFGAFINPPMSSRPRAWWHWMDGNVDESGIVHDLEWLAASGAGGVQAFTGSTGIPQYTRENVAFRSPAWQSAMKCAAATAEKLGLEFAIATSAGWSATGGPWVRPEAGMKKLVWSATRVSAGQPRPPAVPAPPATSGPYQDIPFSAVRKDLIGVPDYYEDVAVLAIPYREGHTHLTPSRIISSAPLGGDRPAGSLVDGRFWPAAQLPVTDQIGWLTAEFDEPTTVTSVRIGLPVRRGFGNPPAPSARLEARNDGESFTRVADLPASPSPVRSATFPAVAARYFRIVLDMKEGGVPPIAPGIVPLVFPAPVDGASAFHVSGLQLFAGPRITRSEEKAGFAPVPDYYALGNDTSLAEGAVRPQDVLDMTSHLRPDGVIDWVPAEGEWTVLRFGYSLTGHLNAPAPLDATGLEVDKLDADLVAEYLTDYLGFFEEAVGADLTGITALLSDSIESGPQNWTAAMRKEFISRRGYDLLPWLPAIAGIVIGDTRQSDDFLWDLRKTITELLAENHYGTIAGMARGRGLTYYAEALEDHRPQLGDDLEMRSHADIPMGAMWCYAPEDGPLPTYVADLRGAASVANIYGKAAVGAESMSVFGKPFTFTPRSLKPIVDMEFALGVNLINIHTSPHQPGTIPGPGVTLAPYLGQSFTRKETWAYAAKPWLDYMGRCSHLLQQGTHGADIAYFYGEEAPVTGVFGDSAPEVPEGYGFDFINLDGLVNHLTVTPDGSLLSTGGTNYRLLYLGGSSHRMTHAAVLRLMELLDAGATVAGRRPERSPSRSDDEVAWTAAVDRLWSGQYRRLLDLTGVAIQDGVSVALARLELEPDWRVDATESARLPIIHRRLEDAELYFVSNQLEQPEKVSLSLRTEGVSAELWDPVRVERFALAVSSNSDRTDISFELEPFGSAFILLRRVARSMPVPELTPRPVSAFADIVLDGPWQVTFDGDGQSPDTITLPLAEPWSGPTAREHSTDVTYFSGTGTYRQSFTVEPSLLSPDDLLVLDLGDVRDLAVVRLNGLDVGTLWTHPFRVDVSSAVRPGENLVEISVTNPWWNRLAGDASAGKHSRPGAAIFEPHAATRSAGLHGPVRLTAK